MKKIGQLRTKHDQDTKRTLTWVAEGEFNGQLPGAMYLKRKATTE